MSSITEPTGRSQQSPAPPAVGRLTLVVTVDGEISREAVLRLCERVRLTLASDTADMVICEFVGAASPDLVLAEAIGRLRLACLRRGLTFKIVQRSPALGDLLAMIGLAEVEPVADDDPG